MYNEKSFIVYQHITPNNKVYIGRTCKTTTQRWRRDGSGYSPQFFYKAIQKYGWNNIQHIIIAENLTNKQSEQLEKDLIKYWNSTNPVNGYNISNGGEFTWLGLHHTEKTKEKIRQLKLGSKGLCGKENPMYGIHWSKEKKAVMSKRFSGKNNPFYGKHHTQDIIEKGRQANLGKHPTEETRKKLRAANKGKNNCMYGKHHTEEAKEKIRQAATGRPSKIKGAKHGEARAVNQYSINGDFIKTWGCLTDASKFYGLKNCCPIWSVCNKKSKTSCGYTWRYLNE